MQSTKTQKNPPSLSVCKWLSRRIVNRQQMLMTAPSTLLLPGLCTHSFHCIDDSPRSPQACSFPSCKSLPHVASFPRPPLAAPASSMHSLQFLCQLLEGRMSPNNVPSSLYLPHSFTGWEQPWGWDLSAHVMMSFTAQQLASGVSSAAGGPQGTFA